jgi:hypothetical protein
VVQCPEAAADPLSGFHDLYVETPALQNQGGIQARKASTHHHNPPA